MWVWRRQPCMTAIKNKSLPLWRIDAGNHADSPSYDVARKIDAAGNRDRRVSLAEIDAYDARLVATMGSPDYNAWTSADQDPVKRQAWVEHARPGPVDEAAPHLPDENERHAVHVTHLQQLPDHQHFEHGADAARHHDERVGRDHEVVEAREEGLVREGLLDERIHVLFER